MSSPSRHFVGWNRSLCESAVAFLSQGWSGDGPLDLEDVLVIVPTRQASRRLREGLALLAAERGTAALPPLVLTPDALFSPRWFRVEGSDKKQEKIASSRIERLLWSALLLRLDLTTYPQLFPVSPVEQNLDWALTNATSLLAVRSLLIESGLDFSEAAHRLARSEMEPMRWRELARLEDAAVALIRENGLIDRGRAALAAARQGVLPDGIRRIVVVGVPDLRPLACESLVRQANHCTVEIVIAAPDSESGVFDDFGRPIPDHWQQREIRFSDVENTLRSCAHPQDLADRCHELLSIHPDPAAMAAFAAIGIPNPKLLPSIERRLVTAGLHSYDPAGRQLSHEGIYHLLSLLSELISGERFATLAQMLRCPGVGQALASISGATSLRSEILLVAADEFASDHLPQDLSDAVTILNELSKSGSQAETQSGFHRLGLEERQAALAAVLRGARSLVARMRRGNLMEELRDFLIAVYADRRFSPHDQETAVLSTFADTLYALETDLTAVSGAFPAPLNLRDRVKLLLSAFGEQHIYPDRHPDSVLLSGWLELLWEDAPHLIVAGMNDQVVPESVVGHAYLPNSARTHLGVLDNASRYARDAYLLTVLVETRREHGRLDLLVAQHDTESVPMRPSRLLFQCPDDQLAGRTLSLFEATQPSSSPLARTVAWQLKPQLPPPDHRIYQSISVTDFKSYLFCPFHYYLKRGLGMEPVEARNGELNAADFGTAIHEALNEFGRNASLAQSEDVGEITTALCDALDRWFTRKYGTQLSTPLFIQRESARRRLSYWAQIEAEERKKGWQIVSTEDRIGGSNWPWQIGGMAIHGRVDRIERHPENGLRVLDFKTSSFDGTKKDAIQKAHLSGIPRGQTPESLPAWMLAEAKEGNLSRWIDLQVPLYCLALGQRFPNTPITAGYGLIGKAVEAVGIDLWTDLDSSLLTSAQICAEGVVQSIRDGIFWPPATKAPEWDNFSDLLFPSASEAIDSSSLNTPSIP